MEVIRNEGLKVMRGHELSELLGLPISTLHYYEKKGLIKPQREENEYRNYSEQDIKMLKYILVLKEAGFSLAEIKQVMYRYFYQEHNADCEVEARLFFDQKIAMLKGKIARYQHIITIIENMPVMVGGGSNTEIKEKNDALVDRFFE